MNWKQEVFVSPHAIERLRERCGDAPATPNGVFMEAIANAVISKRDHLIAQNRFDREKLKEDYPSLNPCGRDAIDNYLFHVHIPATHVNGLRQDGFAVVCSQRSDRPEFKNQLVVPTVFDLDLLRKAEKRSKVLTSMSHNMAEKLQGIQATSKGVSCRFSAFEGQYMLVLYSEGREAVEEVKGFTTKDALTEAYNKLLDEGVSKDRLKVYGEIIPKIRVEF